MDSEIDKDAHKDILLIKLYMGYYKLMRRLIDDGNLEYAVSMHEDYDGTWEDILAAMGIPRGEVFCRGYFDELLEMSTKEDISAVDIWIELTEQIKVHKMGCYHQSH